MKKFDDADGDGNKEIDALRGIYSHLKSVDSKETYTKDGKYYVTKSIIGEINRISGRNSDSNRGWNIRAQVKDGESVPTYEAPKFGFFKDLRKVFLRIKKSLPKDHTYEDFKVKLEKMRSDIYNTYEGEKGAAFDAWLKEMWETTTTQR